MCRIESGPIRSFHARWMSPMESSDDPNQVSVNMQKRWNWQTVASPKKAFAFSKGVCYKRSAADELHARLQAISRGVLSVVGLQGKLCIQLWIAMSLNETQKKPRGI